MKKLVETCDEDRGTRTFLGAYSPACLLRHTELVNIESHDSFVSRGSRQLHGQE